VARAPSPATRRAQRRWFSGPSLAAAAVIVMAVGTVTVMRAGRKSMAPALADRAEAVATRPTSGPAADSFVVATPVPSAAPSPSAPTPAAAPPADAAAKSLGDRRLAAGGGRLAPPPPSVPASRDVANEAGREAASAGVRARLDSTARLEETRQLANVAPATPSVARAKVAQQQAASSELKKEADEVAKDQKQRELDRSERLSLRGAQQLQSAQAESARVQARADASAPAKSSIAGIVRGRVTDANNTGIAGAMVSIEGTNTGVVTNAAGEFTLGGLQGGSYRLTVRRIGYDVASRAISLTPGQAVTTDIVLSPVVTSLSNVVVTGTATAARRERDSATQAKPSRNAPAPAPEAAPGAPITAQQSNAVGCYELGITALGQTRTGFRQVPPRRLALDAEIVPANAGGIWYRARDLARVNAIPNGLWRPTGPDALEIEWTYGSKTARVLVSGPAGSMMRGNVEEIDRATATGEAGSVVAIRRPCDQ
jgi:hypothetical protein